MENIQQNREVYGKKGAVIKFNNNVVENKDTNIIVRTLIDYKTSEKVNIFILRYTINQIPYEVVLGKLQLNKNAGNLGEKAKVIQEFISKQIKANNKGKNNYDFCSHLDSICVKNDIPFIYTAEGIKIVTNNANEDVVMERTYFCDEDNNILKLNNIKPEKRMDQYISEANIRKSINENIKQNKAIETAEKELGPKMMEEFDLGRKLKDYKSEQSEDVIYASRIALVTYMIQGKLRKKNQDNLENKHKLTMQEYLQIKRYYKEKENRDVKIDPAMVIGYPEEETLEKKFFRVKEKAIAIDIKKMLENEQSDYMENKINNEENKEKDSITNTNLNNIINDYKAIFDFIKDGKDVNTQLYYSTISKSFESLKSIVKNQFKKHPNANGQEIMNYLELKEDILKNVKLNKGNGFIDLYDKDDRVKNFIEFVMKSKSRDYTKTEEKKLLADVYRDMVDNMILRHEDAVKLYNNYASRFKAETCEIPNKMVVKTITENPENPEEYGEGDNR